MFQVVSKLYLALNILAGIGVLGFGVSGYQTDDLPRFVCYLTLAVLATGLKVQLPAITGTLSLNFVFVMIGIVELSLPETLIIGATATLIQSGWNPGRQAKLVQVLFNVSNMALAVLATDYVYQLRSGRAEGWNPAVMLVVAGVTFFCCNSIPVALAIVLTEGKKFLPVWSECYFWSFPYYVIGAGVAGAVHFANGFIGWQTSLVILPVVYLIYRSYRLYLGRLDAEKAHAEEMAALHLRTIEALALAIEAKDTTTHEHLQRVQVYAIEVGKALGLAPLELEALRAASLLHDIGKLAVPEHIISKPGKLTPEEFEKMKIHPVVGAELLERVQFPYPVVPIVRSHHEKWNGNGYPDGLVATDIPIGARILAAVDCLDALASDRQYRRALPLDEAMATVISESGTSFDPAIVEILKENYKQYEQMARAKPAGGAAPKLSTDIKIERGLAPGAGFESTSAPPPDMRRQNQAAMPFLASIAAAREEVQALFELAQSLGNSLSLDETLSVLGIRLKRMVPHDCMAIWVKRDGKLYPDYVAGENLRHFSSLEIPVGQGLSGWVVENKKAIVNGNPTVESGYLNDAKKFSTLRSALSVPLESPSGVIGALSLYQVDKDAFTKDHLRILLAITSKLATSIENALKYQQAETSATTDYLTGLPNARSMFVHLDGELSRCRRMGMPLSVMVCDLDGFKETNDRFGHLEGNRVLREVAKRLKGYCRDYDYIARMGGDEFVALLPGLKSEDAAAKASDFEALVREVSAEVCGDNSLSISVGYVSCPQDGSDPEALLGEADRRMYQAKQQRKTAKAQPNSRKSDMTGQLQPVGYFTH